MNILHTLVKWENAFEEFDEIAIEVDQNWYGVVKDTQPTEAIYQFLKQFQKF